MKIGNNEIQKIYVGSTEITKVYAGSDVVYENTPAPTGYTLPDVSYLCNYNAVDFDDDLQTFYRSENTQSLNKDLTRTYGSGTLALDGRKVAINSNWSSTITYANASGNPFNINSNNQDLTVIYKAAPKSGTYDNQNNIIGNRGSNTTYNWMVRVISFHNSVGEQMQFTPSVSPQTIVIRVHNGNGERYCVESEQIATQTGMDFSKQAASVGFFAGFGNALTEPFKGDFYWLYVSREVLTDAQVQQVIDYNEHKEHIEPTPIDYTKEYFTIKALSGGTISWAPSGTVEYSVNEGTWNTWDNTNGLAVSTNDEVRFRSTANTTYGTKTISSTGNIEVYGNSMSLLYGNNFIGQTGLTADNTFAKLFLSNNKLVNAENLILPAKTILTRSYEAMFSGCTSLTAAPTLPAKTLAQYCYLDMFNGCTSLTTAQNLPATTLQSNCYQRMFQGCTSLTTAPNLPSTTLQISCYNSMFKGCTSLTATPTFTISSVKNSSCGSMFENCTGLTTINITFSTAGNANCFKSMFQGCTSLTTAPVLSTTSLGTYCYQSMFQGCTSLTTAPNLPATTLKTGCYQSMFQGCTSLTTAPNLPATNISGLNGCYQSMFQGCTSLTTAPNLPATTLGQSIYQNMFNGCSNLSYVKCLATNISATDCTANWLNGVSATGTFIKDPGMSSWTAGASGIPSGWTIQNSDGTPVGNGGEGNDPVPNPDEEEW